MPSIFISFILCFFVHKFDYNLYYNIILSHLSKPVNIIINRYKKLPKLAAASALMLGQIMGAFFYWICAVFIYFVISETTSPASITYTCGITIVPSVIIVRNPLRMKTTAIPPARQSNEYILFLITSIIFYQKFCSLLFCSNTTKILN